MIESLAPTQSIRGDLEQVLDVFKGVQSNTAHCTCRSGWEPLQRADTGRVAQELLVLLGQGAGKAIDASPHAVWRGQIQGPGGQERDVASMFAANEIIVTAPWAGNPLLEGSLTFGAWRSFLDVANALATGTGEAGPSVQFGQRVHDRDATGVRRGTQILQFMYNNLAPSGLRTVFNFGNPGEPNQGIIPEINRALARPVLDAETAEALERVRRIEQGREERDLWETVFTLAVRTIHPISIDPLTNPVVNDMSLQDYEDQDVARTIRNRIRDIMLADMHPDDKAQAIIDAYEPVMRVEVRDAARLVVALEGMEPPEEGR